MQTHKIFINACCLCSTHSLFMFSIIFAGKYLKNFQCSLASSLVASICQWTQTYIVNKRIWKIRSKTRRLERAASQDFQLVDRKKRTFFRELFSTARHFSLDVISPQATSMSWIHTGPFYTISWSVSGEAMNILM